jgi:hypothetical protein
MKKKIAIVGAGFFGLSIAFFLNRKFDITVFEKKTDILTGASRANQLRFHLGYHYPRSIKTLKEIQTMNKSFIKFYGKDVFGKTYNYYGIAKKNSKTNFDKYIKFLKKNRLYFKIIKNKNFSDKVSGSILSREMNLNYYRIKNKIKKIIKENKIKIRLNTKFSKKDLSFYDKIIICCYDKNNKVLTELGRKPKKKYKFELVEKIIIKLPNKFKNQSFMVLDGKFVSLDPYLGTKYHLLSDVKHSKIEIKKNYYPNFKNKKKQFLDKNIIRLKKYTNFKKFIERSSQYLPFLKKARYIGSFFVTRAIELNKEKTDERLNSINLVDEKCITVFSGKWNTSVGLAKFLLNNIKL